MWFLCIFIISVQLGHGILDGMTCSDVGAVKLRLEEEKEKRLLLQIDVHRQGREMLLWLIENYLSNLVVNQKLVFDKVVTNEGNGYSAITGTFTATPSKYLVSPAADLVIVIVVNGEYKIHVAVTSTNYFNMGGNSAVFRLNAGHRSQLLLPVQYARMYSNSRWYNPTFSGFLVQPYTIIPISLVLVSSDPCDPKMSKC
ncbi:hypothetical protein ACJMK2_016697 [Sinanodonta woodiana]|uniref:C1q domain-containing protein n=1 Tax=Sinanodonta woodiana TaxID=1069815 RepID=A0ABD3UUH4_SINWO